jgi:hypothetical protein
MVSGNEIKQFDDDVTHNPSKHLIGVDDGQFPMLHEVTLGLIQIPDAHFNGLSYGHPLAM